MKKKIVSFVLGLAFIATSIPSVPVEAATMDNETALNVYKGILENYNSQSSVVSLRFAIADFDHNGIVDLSILNKYTDFAAGDLFFDLYMNGSSSSWADYGVNVEASRYMFSESHNAVITIDTVSYGDFYMFKSDAGYYTFNEYCSDKNYDFTITTDSHGCGLFPVDGWYTDAGLTKVKSIYRVDSWNPLTYPSHPYNNGWYDTVIVENDMNTPVGIAYLEFLDYLDIDNASPFNYTYHEYNAENAEKYLVNQEFVPVIDNADSVLPNLINLDVERKSGDSKTSETYEFDLSKIDGTELHQLSGTVGVQIENPLDVPAGTKIKAYRVDDSTGEKIECDVVMNDDGTITFKTNHFSTFVFEADQADAEKKSPKTSDNAMWPYLITMFVGVAVVAVIARKKEY